MPFACPGLEVPAVNYDVAIVGGGPAAHNAALALGRSRKRVLVCDEGMPRNRVAEHSHTFFTRDGTPPLEMRRIAVEQLAEYKTVQFVEGRVSGIEKLAHGYRVGIAGRDAVTTSFVLLAVGMEIETPGIAGFEELWGDTVIHCPYCHGWEARDLPWAAYLTDVAFLDVTDKLRSWTDDVVVIVDDNVSLTPEQRQRLVGRGYAVELGTIRALHAKDGKLESVELEGGRRIPRRVLLYSPPQRQTPLVRELGLDLDETGCVVTDDAGLTSVDGIYAAGDLKTRKQQIAFAAADGLRTAIAIHGRLAAGEVEGGESSGNDEGGTP
jgi:thioredoxin reductase (NADPH)